MFCASVLLIPLTFSISSTDAFFSSVIVLNDESHTCLRITDVQEFFTASEKDVVLFTEEEMSEFYSGTLSVNGKNAFVLKINEIIEKVGKEIAAA